MGAPFQNELLARVRVAERQRELRRIDATAWREQDLPVRPGRAAAARRVVGVALMRAGAWVAGPPVEATPVARPRSVLAP